MNGDPPEFGLVGKISGTRYSGDDVADTADAAVGFGLLDSLEEGLMCEILGHRAVAHIAAAHPDHLRDVPLVRLRPKLFRLHFSLFYNDDAKVRKRAKRRRVTQDLRLKTFASEETASTNPNVSSLTS